MKAASRFLCKLATVTALASVTMLSAEAANKKCQVGTPLEKEVRMERGVDGDTVIIKTLSGSYSVRMLGMDTPETHYLGKTQGEWGDKAAEVLRDLLPVGSKLEIEQSEEGCDKYGRVLAHVFLPRAGKPRLHANAEMIRRGLAVNYCIAPSFEYCSELATLARDAIKNRRGMFSDSNIELPYDFRRRISNRDEDKFVGSILTREVLHPGSQEMTPIADRVFFFTEEDIKRPYRLVD